MTTDTLPPMPDTQCPSWCDSDHDADWRMHVAVGRDTRPIPTADGGRRPALPADGPARVRVAGDVRAVPPTDAVHVDLERDERARVDLQSGDDPAVLYVEAGGAMTSAQARTFAAGLLNRMTAAQQ